MRLVLSLLAVALIFSGCGAGRYSVIRTSSTVEFEPGEWTLLPVQGADAETTAALAEGMHAGLAADAANYRFVSAPSVSGAFGVQVTLHSVGRVEQEVRLDATVAFVDANGRVPDEIRVEIAMPASSSSNEVLGEELGRRTAHFIHSREHHHF